MSVLPNWNSIESTTRWSEVLFWIGAAALVVLAAAAIASRIYASRSASLALEHYHEQQQTNDQAGEQYSREVKRLTDEIAIAKEVMVSAQTISARQQVQSETETIPNKAQADAPSRALTATQQQLLVAALSPFAGQKVVVEFIAGDADGYKFEHGFIAVFKLAEWKFGETTAASRGASSHPPTGVQVTVNEDEVRAGRVLRSARAFAQTLQKLGITKGNTLFVDNQVPVGAIKLTIGLAP
jgi:hypothetical protein